MELQPGSVTTGSLTGLLFRHLRLLSMSCESLPQLRQTLHQVGNCSFTRILAHLSRIFRSAEASIMQFTLSGNISVSFRLKLTRVRPMKCRDQRFAGLSSPMSLRKVRPRTAIDSRTVFMLYATVIIRKSPPVARPNFFGNARYEICHFLALSRDLSVYKSAKQRRPPGTESVGKSHPGRHQSYQAN